MGFYSRRQGECKVVYDVKFPKVPGNNSVQALRGAVREPQRQQKAMLQDFIEHFSHEESYSNQCLAPL